MADSNDLTSINRVDAWVPGIDPAIAARLITAISTQIQNWVSYKFNSQAYARVFSGRGGDRLMLPDYPVTSVFSVAVDGRSIPEAMTTTAPGFVYDDKTIYLRGDVFTRGVRNVEVNYLAGYDTVPADIEQACLEWLKATYERIDRAPGVTKLKTNGHEIDYGPDAFVVGNQMIAPMPASVFALLQPYARVFMA